MPCIKTLLFLLLTCGSLWAQKVTFDGVELPPEGFPSLEKKFTDFSVYEIDPQAIHQYVSRAGDGFNLQLNFGDDYEWNLALSPNDIRSADYKAYAQTEFGKELLPKRPNMTYRGYLDTTGGGKAGFTIHGALFTGTIRDGRDLYYIEPLDFLMRNGVRHLVVVYKTSDVVHVPGLMCGADEVSERRSEIGIDHDHEHHDHDHDHHDGDHDDHDEYEGNARVGQCYEVELAIASDWLMYQAYGQSTALVEDHNVTVMNNVATNWDDEFADEIVFTIVTQFYSTCSSCDPWTANTGAGTLLGSFRSWGNGGGFGVPFDLGQLWTDRNLAGSTIGIAYLNGVCNSNQYHVLQDFSNSQNLLRVLTAHEIGHNFSSQHDAGGSPFIMAPAVNNTSDWSTASQNSINNYINFKANQGNCFSSCPADEPPVPLFTGSPTQGCAPLTVQFTDQSTGEIESWLWTFPGGTPAASTEQNPSVTYTTGGIYDVTLTVTNGAGSESLTLSSYVFASGPPTTSFTYEVLDEFVYFTNTTIDGNTYFWDFGDGTTSTEVNPVHQYAEDGQYLVTLFATNACGTSSTTLVINVATPPIPDFTADPTFGCNPLTVQFQDASTSNAQFWIWTFPGGDPATSNEQNPTVTYNAPGTFSVTLQVVNTTGSNSVTISDMITVNPSPVPGFTSSVDGNTVTFTNTTTNAVSYSWDFGDGNSSIEENPVHTYDDDGEYIVTLTVTSDCGEESYSEAVNILGAPAADFTVDETTGCAPLTVAFTDNSSANATSWDWEFPGGDPSSSTEQNPTVTYDNPGTYSVTLTVSNAAGEDVSTQTDLIVVNTTPTAGFSSSTNGDVVDFTNTSTNADSYNWDFGDGNSSTAENPSHTYDMDGTYEVILSATNECGTVTSSETITITTAPTAGFSADATSGCAPLTVAFTDNSSANATSWDWEFPGGDPSSSTAQNPTVTYNNPGTYSVTLTVSNAAGDDVSTQTNLIVVNTTPTAGFSSTVNGDQVSFTNSSTNADSYSWDFGDGNSSTDENPSHTYDTDGTYEVVLSATNECGTVTSTETITITLLPTAGFSANTTSGCAPLTVQFTNSSSANTTSWDWSFPGGNPSSSTEQNPTVTYDNPGTYSVTLTASNAAGEDVSTQTDLIVVNTTPTAGFSSNTNGDAVDFTNTSTNADSYSWDFGDGNSSTAENPSHTYDMDGTYEVVLSATNACGTVTSTETITITTLPTAGFSANVTSGCAPLMVQFTNSSSANATSWDWSFSGGNPSSSTEQNPTVTYNTAGTYSVTLTVSNAAGEDVSTQTDLIVVTTTPVASFSSTVDGDQVDFMNTSTNADSYSWDFGDGNSSTDENPNHTYDMDGTYEVTLSATNECGTVTTTQTVNIGTLPTASFSANVTSGCAPLTVQFTNSSSANATSWDWEFPGGNPSSSTAQNPTVTYETAGTYNVILTVSNASGSNTSTQTNYIMVNTVPTAAFSTSTNGLQADFMNSSTDATSYSWDFGDGNSSTATNPSHEYDADGEYTVTLTATNDCGSVTTEETITIVTAPTPNFSASILSGCAPLTVQFSDASSANATAWNWTFEGGNPATSTAQNPIVTFDNPGSYSVTLEVSNAAGSNSTTQTNYIVVNAGPTAAFTTSGAGAVFTFNNTSTNADSYSWDFGDGNGSSENNPIHTYDADGEYEVTLTVTNACGTNSITQSITAVTPPSPDFSSNVTSGCAPLTVQFSDASSANSTTWSWTFEGGNPATSTEQNPSVVFESAGTYAVTLEVSNSAGSNSLVQTDYITVSTTPDVGFTSNPVGTTVSFNNLSNNATSYSWDFGDGNSSEDTNPTHEYDNDGTYTVTLSATNACGTVSISETIEVVTAPLAGFSADVTIGCASLTVQFMDQSSDNTTSWSWSFPGGNPSSSTEQHPTVVYNTPGNYNVSLVATTSAGSNTYEQIQFIQVQTVPGVAFDSNIDGNTVNFLNNSNGATSYNWDFGDGEGSTAPNPTHTYAVDGDYTVVLTATNDCGSVTTEQIVSIISAPLSAFAADVTLGCGPLTVQFTDQSSGLVSNRLWTFTGGIPATSTEANPVVVFNNAGTYSVSLEVSNAAGTDTETTQSYITVEAPPIPMFSPTITGATVTFNNQSSNGNSYSWDLGDGTMTDEESPFHIYDTDGVYDVSLTVTNSCGSVTTTQQITIVTPPSAAFSVDNSNGCAPLTVTFNNLSSQNSENYSWTFEGGTPETSTEPNPTVVYNTPGVYNVVLTVSNAAGNDVAEEIGIIVVEDIPMAGFDLTLDDPAVDLTNTSINADSYEWHFGDGATSDEADPSHTYTSAGTFEVMLISTNACGQDTSTQEVTIVGTPPQVAFIYNPDDGCVPLTVEFEDNSSGGPTSWAWSFPGGTPETSNEQNPVIVYDEPGTYDVSLTVTNAFGEDVGTLNSIIEVQDEPSAAFNYESMDGATYDFTNLSTGGDSYDWNFGDGNSSMDENPSHTYTESGNYTVILNVTNECGTTKIEQMITVIITSVDNITGLAQFDVYPNPNNGQFLVVIQSEQLEQLQFRLFNVLGQSLYQRAFDVSSGYFAREFNFSDLASGTYLLQVQNGKQASYQKIIIE